MGNCQTADAASVVIQHPPGSARVVERAYGVTTAAAVMSANPGHYVAAVMQTGAAPSAKAKRRLKLLRPDDTLALGGVYRLVSFEDVLQEFVSKRHAALSRVVVAEDSDAHRPETDCSLAKAELPLDDEEPTTNSSHQSTEDHRPSDQELLDIGGAAMVLGGRLGLARMHEQWRPALPSITEGSVMY